LISDGMNDKAKALLETFIAANPADMDSASIPELKEAQRQAKEMLKSF
jgi:NADH:ubiquinone oxidoreductase subunit E